jgi:hypothetical protein
VIYPIILPTFGHDEKHGQDAIYYAHAGAGEIQLRPILNLKRRGLYQFRAYRHRSGGFGQKNTEAR